MGCFSLSEDIKTNLDWYIIIKNIYFSSEFYKIKISVQIYILEVLCDQISLLYIAQKSCQKSFDFFNNKNVLKNKHKYI